MLRLMKKNVTYFVFYAAVIMPLLTLYFFLVRKEFSGAMVLFQGLWLILIVVGALAVNEKTEEKSRGYDFLRTLPTQKNTKGEILARARKPSATIEKLYCFPPL